VTRFLRGVARDPAPPPAGAAEERQQFAQDQERFFAGTGELIQQEIVRRAGLRQAPATAQDTLRITALWGLTIEQIAERVPEVSRSLSDKVQGRRESTTLATQQQRLVDALAPAGKQAYEEVMRRVRAEAFWRRHLDREQIYVFPDLRGRNRYAGYTQRGTAEDDGSQAFIVHLSKDALNAGEVDSSAATLVHELSHTIYEPAVVQRSLAPLLGTLSELVADHPRIRRLRRRARDQAQARATQIGPIRQLLHERTGYAEGEIFVHLQQLTHMPAETTLDGERVRGSDYNLATVQHYLERLKRIGIPPRMLHGILDSLARRSAILYERRIEAAPARSRERELLRRNKDLALALLQLARSETETR
jgi:hypothetical protein